MRPVELVAEGFAAFRTRVTLDFEGVDFFALVGPTGAGKSSVIDAICFALYGSVPRYENKSVVAPAITIGASEAKVSLVFDAAGARYRATRVVRRSAKGGATTREARLERVDRDPVEVLAGTADELSEQVEAILGLGFDYFTRCVVLPQGEFARFLHDKPSDRQQLLASLLGIQIYERLMRRARQMAETARSTAELSSRRLADFAIATPAARAEAEARAAAMCRLEEELRAAEPGLAALVQAAAEHRAAAERAERLAGLLATIVVPPAVAQAGEALRSLDERAAAVAVVLTGAEQRRAGLAAAVAVLPPIEPLETARRAHSDLRSLATSLRDADAQLERLAGERETAAAVASAASASLEAALARLESLRRAHSAAELAAHLTAGAPCPVCENVVRQVPRRQAPAALAEASAAVEGTRTSDRAAAAAASSAGEAVAAAAARRAALEEKRAALVGLLAPHPDELALRAAIESAHQLRAEAGEALAAEDAVRAEHRALVAEVGGARAAQAEAARHLEGLRNRVGELGPPAPARTDLLADWTALAAWAERTRPGLAEIASRESADADRCTGEAEDRLAWLAGRCTEVGVEASRRAALADLRVATATAAATAAALASKITEAIEEAERLRAEIAAAEEEAAVADLLANHLRSTGFERWLVAEALDLLVAGASETLLRLSGSQYSLGRDERNEFLVVDHRNADERRPAKTLSGGETFQASLALALAMADQLAGLASSGGACLESIFLDEGFGTLDPDALATVADTIEALGSEERMVGIVTHVRELAERVPVRFEVAKTARTSTVDRRPA